MLNNSHSSGHRHDEYHSYTGARIIDYHLSLSTVSTIISMVGYLIDRKLAVDSVCGDLDLLGV
jgi:hypothetical protein